MADNHKNGTFGPVKQVLVFLAIVLPPVVLGIVSYTSNKAQFNDLVLHRRDSLVKLAAELLKERLDNIVNLGHVIASDDEVKQAIMEDRWQDAAKAVEHIPQQFPVIATASLFDPEGTLKATTSPAVVGLIGRNFALRDYYRGVTKDWKPYVSEIFTAVSPVNTNGTVVAVPIFDDLGKPIGIVIFQVVLGTITDWTQELDAGDGGIVYVTDQTGKLASRGEYTSEGPIQDYSLVPAVRKALEGNAGVQIDQDPTDRVEKVFAYTRVQPYGWTVVVSQPTKDAFAETNRLLELILLRYGSILLINIIFAVLVVRLMRSIDLQRRKEVALLESIGEGLIATDQTYKVLVINKAAKVMLGWEALRNGKNHTPGTYLEIPNIVDGDGDEIALEDQPAIQALTTGKKIVIDSASKQEVFYVRKDGSKFPVAITATPVTMGKKIVGVIVVFRDISKERELDRAKSEFISLASHQLKTPPTAMRWNLDMLSDKKTGKLTKKQQAVVHQMEEVNTGMINIVNALLNTSRLELSTFIVDPKPVDFAATAHMIVEEMKSTIQKKHLTVEESYDESVPLIPADQGLARVMVENLISNAVKYTPENGTVRIEIVPDSQTVGVEAVHIRVQDTGVGIPKEQQENIFKKMFRADNVKNMEGTGLGLYLLKAIVEQSDGKVWFESEEGKGTIFHIVLPYTGMKKKSGTSRLS